VSTCAACAELLPAGARFCLACGTPAPLRSCGACGTPAERGRFCGNCGQPLDDGSTQIAAPVIDRPVAERRVTSVLFADLVGFTPLSESMDAEEVRELLSTYFAQCRVVIGRYGGVVEKFIGDAVMAVWGVPVAHEDDAERAVRAGLELVATVAAMGQEVGAQGLALRVGVVTGEVAVTVGATAEGMVAGDAVNTAARVQSAAEPGHVWVDETTRGLSSAAISFTDTGEHALKGKAEPMRLYEAGVVVSDLGGGQRVDGLEAPLTGRGSELRMLKELFHATEESSRPRLVVLDGAAGTGKSRMSWEFDKYADGLTASTWWHRGRCLSYGDGIAFWALSEAIRSRFGLVEADAGDIVLERLDLGLLEYVDDPGERDWLRPRLAVLLGEGSGATFDREDMFAAWTGFLEHLGARGGTVVLVIDDAQHADDGLLDFLDHMLATARTAVFVLAVARPELLARRPELGGRRATVVRLEPLDDVAMGDLVDGLVVGLPASTRAALVERAEGIPLFAVETVRALIDRDLVIARGGHYVPADGVELDLAAIGAPASLQALVAARLDALTAEEKKVVTDASVLGATFTRDGLAALGSDADGLDPLLGSLMRKEILAVQSDRFSADRGQYRFVQSVVRQVAYATQSRHDRKARHLAAADHLAAQTDRSDELAVIIAEHLLDAVEASAATDPDVPRNTSRARDYLERAAARARLVGAPAEALRLLESALEHTTEPADRARQQLEAARAADDAADYAAARRHAAEAAVVFDDLGRPVDAALATAVQATALYNLGDIAAACEVAVPRCRAVDGVPGAEPALLALQMALSLATSRSSDWDAQARYTERVLLLAEDLDDRDALAQTHIQMGLRYQSIGATRTALASYATALSIGREHDLPGSKGRALLNLAAAENSRDLPAALAHAVEAMEVLRRAGLQRLFAFATVNHLIGLWTAGRYDEARQRLPDVREDSDDPSIIATLDTLAGWLCDLAGEPVPGRAATLDTATEDVSDRAWLTSHDLTLARTAGRTSAVASLAGATLADLLAARGLDDDFFVLWPPLVLAALAEDDLDLADRLLQPVAAAPSGRLSPAVVAQWLRLRGLVGAARGDDPSTVEADLRAGIEALQAFGAVGERARAEEELARWLVEQDRPAEAAPLVVSARETYVEIGAEGWLARLDAWEAGRLSDTRPAP
jgi:class 3 adenylate cyclase/tetratricopeptide (TPR) repeat protein